MYWQTEIADMSREIDSRWSRLSEQFSVLGRFMIGFAGICYTLGFAITALFLSRYGIQPPALLEID